MLRKVNQNYMQFVRHICTDVSIKYAFCEKQLFKIHREILPLCIKSRIEKQVCNKVMLK